MPAPLFMRGLQRVESMDVRRTNKRQRAAWRERQPGNGRAAWWSFVWMLLATSPAAAQVAQAVQGAGSEVDRAIAIATFDSAWTRIHRTHYDTMFNGVDWTAVRTELRPRAADVRTMQELRGVLNDMLSRLGESHFSLIPNELAEAVDPARANAGEPVAGGLADAGMELRLAGDRLVVWRVDSAGPAARAGVLAGWVVEQIAAFRTDEAIARLRGIEGDLPRRNARTQFLWSARTQLEGPAGSLVAVRFRDGNDLAHLFTLRRHPRSGEPVRFGNLPTFMAQLEHTRIPVGDRCIGAIRFNIWMVPLAPRFDRAIDALRDCSGIIIDLRGNPGGIAGMVMGVAGHFLDDRVSLGTMRSRTAELHFVANPRRVSTSGDVVEPFDGPLAILVDNLSVSTSEFFAGGMQAIGRARVFGENTAGQALPATLLRLPSGDVLMHVVADFTAAGGLRIEGKGVVPDHVTPLDRDRLLAGRDVAFDAAFDWLRNQSPSDRTNGAEQPAATVRRHASARSWEE